MNWPKQVRRGLTGLAMTSAAWVHAVHAAPLPESGPDALTDSAMYQAAIAQAEMLRQQNGGFSTARPRVEQQAANPSATTHHSIRFGSVAQQPRIPVQQAAAFVPVTHSQLDAPMPPAPVAAVNVAAPMAAPASVLRPISITSVAPVVAPATAVVERAVFERPAAMAASEAAPNVVATPIAPIASAEALAELAPAAASNAHAQRWNAGVAPVASAATTAPAALAQPLAYKGQSPRPRITATVTRTPFVPVTQKSSNPAFAMLDPNETRQYAAEQAAQGRHLFHAQARADMAEQASLPAVNDFAELSTAAGGNAANTNSHHRVMVGAASQAMPFQRQQFQPTAVAPAVVMKAAPKPASAPVASALPEKYSKAELTPPPARAIAPVIVAAAPMTNDPAAQAGSSVSEQEAAKAYATIRARHGMMDEAASPESLAQLQPAAGGVRIMPMLSAASAAQADALLSLPLPESASGAPVAAPLSPLEPLPPVQLVAPLAPLPDAASPLPPLPVAPAATEQAGAVPLPVAPVPSAEPPLPTTPDLPSAAVNPPVTPVIPPSGEMPPSLPLTAADAVPLPGAKAAPSPAVAANAPVAAPVPLSPEEQAKIDAATGMPAAPADLQVPVQSLAETVTAPTPPEPPIPLPVAPPDRSRAMSASAPAPKTTPDKVLSAQQKKLAAEARNESMQANKMPIQMERSRPLDTRLNGEGESRIQRHEGVGLSIAVRTPRLDAAYELGQAYEALMGGDTVVAAAIYQRILDVQPRNVDALFGLATTYHRVGALEKAKPLYATLLAVAPDHRDGLNNFLMLLGEENPAEALARLKSLEAANRSYAPIPAQIAMIYERMGDMASAVDAMTRAVSRAPENVQYRYNLAVLLDKAGNWNDAASIYQDVLAAVDRGERVPSSRDDIQSRLRYLLTNHG